MTAAPDRPYGLTLGVEADLERYQIVLDVVDELLDLTLNHLERLSPRCRAGGQ